LPPGFGSRFSGFYPGALTGDNRVCRLRRVHRNDENKPERGRRRAKENFVHCSPPALTPTEGKSRKARLVPEIGPKGSHMVGFTALQ
jgi:hypothetical protein